MTDLIAINTNTAGIAEAGAMPTDPRALYLKNLKEGMSANTFRAYESRLDSFSEWCSSHGHNSLPAEPYTVALYVEHLKATGHKIATIKQSLAAISKQHTVIAGLGTPCKDPTKDPQVKASIKASSRQIGVAPHQKAAITSEVLSVILEAISGDSLKAMRDRALLALGFMGAFRRSELASLKVSDLARTMDKSGRAVLLATVRRSKTDQTGAGMEKAIFAASKTVNAVALIEAWISGAHLSGDMPLFPSINRHGKIKSEPLSGAGIALIIKDRAEKAGVELDVSGHSLRRGFVTSAINAGATERSIMHQTGHKSVQMVRRYIERAEAISDNAAALL